MVPGGCFSSHCGYEQRGRKSQLASTLSKALHSYSLNNRSITVKPTDVSPDHLDAENLEEEVPTDGQSQKLPIGNIVARPMACVYSCPHTVAPTDNKWSSVFAF